jgi:hypothetical protein
MPTLELALNSYAMAKMHVAAAVRCKLGCAATAASQPAGTLCGAAALLQQP